MKQRPKTLLNRNPDANTKISKTQKGFNPFDKPIFMAHLNLFPDLITCPSSKAAKCLDPCLNLAGRGKFSNVQAARKAKTEFWHEEPDKFLELLDHEITLHEAARAKKGQQSVIRLNVTSDIAWEDHGIIQNHPDTFFYDYTKRAKRIDRTPENYKLMFSYSGEPRYQKQVEIAKKTDAPIAVVFRHKLPDYFDKLDRQVKDGDQTDLANAFSGPVVVGLLAKGPAKTDRSNFVQDVDRIPVSMG
tara:strand:+ start:47 stop:781 length:735 start_codon:yes stop_codon:yes gene_type:complete